jgi:hypothetical protein
LLDACYLGSITVNDFLDTLVLLSYTMPDLQSIVVIIVDYSRFDEDDCRSRRAVFIRVLTRAVAMHGYTKVVVGENGSTNGIK